MKKLLKLSVFVLIFSLFAFRQGVAQTYSDPIDYNNAIIDELNKVYDYVIQLDSIAGEDVFDYKNYEKVRKGALRQIKKSLKNLKKIGDLDGDPVLKNAAITYLQETKDVIENEWKEIGEKMKDFDNLNDTELALLVDIISTAYDKDEDMMDKFEDAQTRFAAKHDYDLE